MDAKVEQRPQKRKKKKKNLTSHPLPPPFLALPSDIVLNCLARISKSHYRLLSLVSKSIRSLIHSPELYQFRSLLGNTEPYLYLCQNLPTYDRLFLLDRALVTDGCTEDDEFSLSQIKPSSSSLYMSTTVAVGFEIYQVGGIINDRPSSAVHVFDCLTHTWRDAPNMTVPRKRAESAFIDGKIFVIGGTEKSSSMAWAEFFDLKTQNWKPLTSPNNDNAKVELHLGKLYVRSEHKEYAYDSKEGRWKELVELVSSPEYRVGSPRPWCVIENTTYSIFGKKLCWYDSERRNWLKVMDLENMRNQHGTIRLANYGGKLVILWDQQLRPRFNSKRKRIWCAVIRLEKHNDEFSQLLIEGKIERLNVVLGVPISYKFLSCITL